MSFLPRILITPGEPAGIGPDIVLQIAQENWQAELIVIADPELLSARAKQLKRPIKLMPTALDKIGEAHQIGSLKIIPVALTKPAIAGKLDPANAAYVLQCLQIATQLCLEKKTHALVTGPVNKFVINEAGIAFTGHTAFLADYTKTSQVLMLFVVNQLRVALQTVHLPLKKVVEQITIEGLVSTVRLLHQNLRTLFRIRYPNIIIAGLNPHAGEAGYLGREEIDIIQPAITQLAKENIQVIGPLPADTLFTEKYLSLADAILGMYHDQVLPVVKHIGWHSAVNVTLGLPIIRTSVDHGTALDIAGTLNADAGSLRAAIQLAMTLSERSPLQDEEFL